jgi:hypothetical protein
MTGGTMLDLPWAALAGWIDLIPDPTTLGWMVELVEAGLERLRSSVPIPANRSLCGSVNHPPHKLKRAAHDRCRSQEPARRTLLSQ